MTDASNETLTAEQIEERADEMLMILDNIDDEQERIEAKQMLMDTHGVDPDTRLAITDHNEEAKPETETQPEDQTKDSQANEPDATSDADSKSETTSPDAGESTDPQLEALRQELAAANSRISELENTQNTPVDDTAFRQKADEVVAQQIADLAAERETAKSKIESYRENYGDEAADELTRTMDESFELKEHAIDVAWQDIYDAEKEAHDTEIRASSLLMTDINQVPELKTWYEDASNNNKPRMWDLAANMDQFLRQDDAWKDKPQVERFKEVVNRVKIASGEQSGPPPTPQVPEKSTSQAIDEAISKDANKSTNPSTLSDLPGSITSETINDLTDISMSKLAALSVDDLMKMGEQLQ